MVGFLVFKEGRALLAIFARCIQWIESCSSFGVDRCGANGWDKVTLGEKGDWEEHQ